MSQKRYWLILSLAALCALCAAAISAFTPEILTSALGFPYQMIGFSLRKLSLLSAGGNIAAWVIYVLFCLTPAAVFAMLRIKNRFVPADLCLPLLSLTLFFCLYLCINPHLLVLGELGITVLCGALHSILIGYSLLRLMHSAADADLTKLQRFIRLLLYAFAVFFVYLIFSASVQKLTNSVKALFSGNTERSFSRTFTLVLLVIGFICDILPYAMNLFVIESMLNLFSGSFSPDNLIQRCQNALKISILSTIGYNALQVFCVRALLHVHITIELPLFALGFLAAVMLLAQYVRENRQLKADNDLFI